MRADTLLDVAADDRAVSSGGTRRPGNLWTAQAREDMFRRREAGETWETICLVRLILEFPARIRSSTSRDLDRMTHHQPSDEPPADLGAEFWIIIDDSSGLPESLSTCHATTIFRKSSDHGLDSIPNSSQMMKKQRALVRSL